MVKPKHVFILVAAVAAMAVFFTMRGDTGAERAELAERMILIENEPEYVTTFTTPVVGGGGNRGDPAGHDGVPVAGSAPQGHPC